MRCLRLISSTFIGSRKGYALFLELRYGWNISSYLTTPLAPSKDRLDNDPDIGYTAGNVQLVVRLINLAKVQTSNEDFNEAFYTVVDYAKSKN